MNYKKKQKVTIKLSHNKLINLCGIFVDLMSEKFPTDQDIKLIKKVYHQIWNQEW